MQLSIENIFQHTKYHHIYIALNLVIKDKLNQMLNSKLLKIVHILSFAIAAV